MTTYPTQRRLTGHCFGALFLAAALAATAVLPAAVTTPLHLDEKRLERLDAVIQQHVNARDLAGVVMYIAKDGEPARITTYGQQDLEAGTAMAPDAIFRIASMSKAVTTVAIMMLYEEGKFMLHDPISNYIPAFKNSVVAVAPPEGSPDGVNYVTVKAKRPIQIRDLLTHTAGLTYGTGRDLAAADYKAANASGWYLSGHDETIAEFVDRLATLPLHGQPGESWQYGYSIDVLGRLVEVASGLPFDQFVAERICGPLGMVDTCFFLPPEKAGRLANVYGIEKGQLVLKETAADSDFVHGPRQCFSGGAGLLSTASDYGRFLQMLLNEGELDGVRLLSPKSVELMRTNQIGDKYRRDTDGFGLGFWVNNDLGYFGELGSEGAYGWGSAYYPQYFVDPEQKLVALLMTQLTPTGGLTLNQQFKPLVYQALLP